MGQKGGNADKVTGYAAKRDILLKVLPKYGFVVAKAAREAKYSESYINSGLNKTLAGDPWFCAERDRLKAEFIGLEDNEIESADMKLKNLINTGSLTPALLLKALELFYRRKGALHDKLAVEDPARERELSTAARAHARRLSVVLMKEQSDKKEGAA